MKIERKLDSDKYAISFAYWLMDNCLLAKDNSLWSYDSEEYSIEKLLEIYKNKL